MKMPDEMTDDELLECCTNYDLIMQHYQTGRLHLGDNLKKLLRQNIQEVYDEIKYRMELREMSEMSK